MYFTDRGIDEPIERRGHERITLVWLADRLRTFAQLHPNFTTPTEQFAAWLAEHDDDEELDASENTHS